MGAQHPWNPLSVTMLTRVNSVAEADRLMLEPRGRTIGVQGVCAVPASKNSDVDLVEAGAEGDVAFPLLDRVGAVVVYDQVSVDPEFAAVVRLGEECVYAFASCALRTRRVRRRTALRGEELRSDRRPTHRRTGSASTPQTSALRGSLLRRICNPGPVAVGAEIAGKPVVRVNVSIQFVADLAVRPESLDGAKHRVVWR